MADPAAMLASLGEFARAETRPAAARALARAIGCDDLILFTPDPELDVLLPAPGLPQTLRAAGEWHAFLDRCGAAGEHTAELTAWDGSRMPARGIAIDGGGVAVGLGAGASEADLPGLLPVFTLLSALLSNERRVQVAEVRVSRAGEAVERGAAVTQALQAMRVRLEAALLEAEAAHGKAAASGEAAETYAEELQAQTLQLEEQTMELEMLNAQLEARTKEAESARAAADTANRAKSGFLATMSHELRTPINAIIGYTELLDMGISGAVTPEQRTHLERVRASSRQLLTLVNDVLDLAKIEAGHMRVGSRTARIADAAHDAVALLALQASERSLSLRNECGDDDATYIGDEDRVRQIVANLVSNAIKFTERGTVTLRCGTTDRVQRDRTLPDDGTWTYLEVEDTGIGMQPDELARVFQPFVQAETGHRRGSGGTGLGLTISRQLARLMGGDLVARSERGKGSCFTLWLPTTLARVGQLDDSIRVGVNEPTGRS